MILLVFSLAATVRWFTNLNNYPLNIFIHGLGAIGWSIAGLITKDRALMTNFGLQIPLFVIGYTYYLS